MDNVSYLNKKNTTAFQKTANNTDFNTEAKVEQKYWSWDIVGIVKIVSKLPGA